MGQILFYPLSPLLAAVVAIEAPGVVVVLAAVLALWAVTLAQITQLISPARELLGKVMRVEEASENQRTKTKERAPVAVRAL